MQVYEGRQLYQNAKSTPNTVIPRFFSASANLSIMSALPGDDLEDFRN